MTSRTIFLAHGVLGFGNLLGVPVFLNYFNGVAAHLHANGHTVIEPHCTGCELCIAGCPVDCISLENVTGEQTGWAAWSQRDADAALARYEFHSFLRPSLLAETDNIINNTQPADSTDAQTRRDVIAQAIAKSRANRSPG